MKHTVTQFHKQKLTIIHHNKINLYSPSWASWAWHPRFPSGRFQKRIGRKILQTTGSLGLSFPAGGRRLIRQVLGAFWGAESKWVRLVREKAVILCRRTHKMTWMKMFPGFFCSYITYVCRISPSFSNRNDCQTNVFFATGSSLIATICSVSWVNDRSTGGWILAAYFSRGRLGMEGIAPMAPAKLWTKEAETAETTSMK